MENCMCAHKKITQTDVKRLLLHSRVAPSLRNETTRTKAVACRQLIFKLLIKVADLNFGCATFCALPSFGAVTTFSSHTTVSSHKLSVKGSAIDMCSAIYFLFDHNTNYCTTCLCPHTVVATI